MNTATAQRSQWRAARKRSSAACTRVIIGILIALGLAMVVGIPLGVASEGWSAAAAALQAGGVVLLLAVIVVVVSWMFQSGFTPSRNHWRVLRVQLLWTVPALGIRLPAEHRRGRPRLVVSVLIVLVLAVAFLRSSVWHLLTEHVSGPVGDAQVQLNADRSRWYASSWAGSIPGLVLVSGVVWEELVYRGVPLLIVAATFAVTDSHRRAHRVVRAVVVITAWAVSSVVFGIGHSEFSDLNAVSAAINGAVWGGAALWTRSLVPAVAGHTFWNLMSTGVI
ncbi:hypothetical protein CH260_23885 [Rhodococcus sp. 05-2256-B2]|uniref:CPBP family intramembrane glutamic endopeptidase n=1 Tax=unclassified Rhodococcus (in: high G+C Gram-positive bacteria) TaxID=192944 RepID=UPI000B9A2B6E|nr:MULTISPECIES: CPBP family intramembrane glutamic endopeptidase [unclassified Rhodococcus (in: high G+C Gram-positive bacteria)]OZD86537.1 hypothetical protein CH257_26340 [Rhodococcus sp. 05-2256-B3]OZD90733.1 hypothetical protein CH260_23885 [Rhodococcus sp. 05-2256-B2]OZD94445.1 hypothetical protein CH258_00105 [Rhodococcus sp. 05-2256-B4]OZE07150.1 hypothetical protein CH285_04765 [Rhodococcus sp. 05-2256-B1]